MYLPEHSHIFHSYLDPPTDPNPYNLKWAADRNGKTQQQIQEQIEGNYSSWICADLQDNHPTITVRDGEDSTKVSLTINHLFVTGSTIKPTPYGPIEFLQFNYTSIVNRPLELGEQLQDLQFPVQNYTTVTTYIIFVD